MTGQGYTEVKDGFLSNTFRMAEELASLRADNKALLAENERLQSERYEYRQFSIDYAVERDRATAAEAKLAKVEAERDRSEAEAKQHFAQAVENGAALFVERSKISIVSAELAEARKGISDPDLLSMSDGVIRLHYEDLDAAQAAFDWLDAFLASKEASYAE